MITESGTDRSASKDGGEGRREEEEEEEEREEASLPSPLPPLGAGLASAIWEAAPLGGFPLMCSARGGGGELVGLRLVGGERGGGSKMQGNQRCKMRT